MSQHHNKYGTIAMTYNSHNSIPPYNKIVTINMMFFRKILKTIDIWRMVMPFVYSIIMHNPWGSSVSTKHVITLTSQCQNSNSKSYLAACGFWIYTYIYVCIYIYTYKYIKLCEVYVHNRKNLLCIYTWACITSSYWGIPVPWFFHGITSRFSPCCGCGGWCAIWIR